MKLTINKKIAIEEKRVKESSEKKWPLDSENGLFSYKKLLFELD